MIRVTIEKFPRAVKNSVHLLKEVLNDAYPPAASEKRAAKPGRQN